MLSPNLSMNRMDKETVAPRRTAAKRYSVTQLHLWMIFVTTLLTILCLVLYAFSKDAAILGIVTTLIGFLVGKFSNGFGEPILKRDADTTTTTTTETRDR